MMLAPLATHRAAAAAVAWSRSAATACPTQQANVSATTGLEYVPALASDCCLGTERDNWFACACTSHTFNPDVSRPQAGETLRALHDYAALEGSLAAVGPTSMFLVEESIH